MSAAQKYLMQARNRNRNAYHNFVDDGMNNYGFVNQPSLYAADGATAPAAPSAPVKRSQPYAITISSASGAAVENFDVLGAYQYINNSGFTAGGSLVIGSVTISSAIPNVSYLELLYQSMNNPFTVGLTYLSCSSPVAQVQEVFSIQTKDANGTVVTIPIVPNVDPYQFQNGINAVNQEYRIDGYTKLTFANILPNAILTIRWFPSDNLNPARALGGQAVGRQFGNPGVIRENIQVVPGQAGFAGPTLMKSRLG